MKEFQEIMGMKDVADFLGVTRQYIDRLARNGTLRHQKTSGGLIFLKSDIIEFRDQRKRKKHTVKRKKQ